MKLFARHDKANPLADQARPIVGSHCHGCENDSRVGSRTYQRYMSGDFGRCCRSFARSENDAAFPDNTSLEKIIGALNKCGQALRPIERSDTDTMMPSRRDNARDPPKISRPSVTHPNFEMHNNIAIVNVQI